MVGTHFWPLKSPPLLASPRRLEGGKNSHYRKSSFSNNATEPLHGTSFLPLSSAPPALFFRLNSKLLCSSLALRNIDLVTVPMIELKGEGKKERKKFDTHGAFNYPHSKELIKILDFID